MLKTHVYCIRCKSRFYGDEDDLFDENYYCSHCAAQMCNCACCGNIMFSYVKRKDGIELCDQCVTQATIFPNRWLMLRFQLLKRDGFKCRYCGRSPLHNLFEEVVLHADHIEPKAAGGKNELSNLVTSCRECNLGKIDVLLEECEKNLIQNRKVHDEHNTTTEG